MATRVPLEQRFWSKVDRRGPNECWPWTGSKSDRGYGLLLLDGKLRRAHRIAWELENGQPLGAAFACHKCDNPCCVNPNHLWRGTATDNVRDMVRKRRQANNRKTHCKRGHEFTPDNTHVRDTGRRECLTCRQIYNNKNWRELTA